VTQDEPGPDPTEHAPADHGRSGDDVVEAVETAAAGTPHDGVQTAPEDMKPHASPVEQVRGDEGMTQGQGTDGQGTDGPGGPSPTSEVSGTSEAPSSPDPAEAGSGGAQSMVGGRVSDRTRRRGGRAGRAAVRGRAAFLTYVRPHTHPSLHDHERYDLH